MGQTTTPGGINPQPRTLRDHQMNWQRLCAFLANASDFDSNGTLLTGIKSINFSSQAPLTSTVTPANPLVQNGSLSLTWANQSAHTFFRGPLTGSATTPFFGALIPGDFATGGTAGKVLSIAGTDNHFEWDAAAGTGTVTSVGLAGPTDSVSITVSPVSSTGTLTWVWTTQSAHAFHAGPYSGSPAAPTWRNILANDLATGGSTTQVLSIADTNGNLTWTAPSGGGGGGASGNGYQRLTFTNPGASASLINRSGWTVSASASGGGAASNAVDGSTSTRWATGATIVANTDFFKIDTGASQTIGAVVLDDSNFTGDIPSTGDIKTSPDDITYTTRASWTTGDILAGVLSKAWTPVTARYVKLVATATANGGAGNWWSIGEINLYDTGLPVLDSNNAASQTITADSTGTLIVTALVKRDSSARNFGFRVGADSSNWFGVLWTSTSFKCQKSVANVITDLGTTATVDNDTHPHQLTLTLAMANTTNQCWWVGELSKNSGSQWTVSVADGSLNLGTGTLKIYAFVDLPENRLRTPSYLLM